MDDQPAPRNVVLTPENVASINRAYAEAVSILGRTAKQDLRIKLAKPNLALARKGELGKQHLCSLSVAAALGHIPDHELGQAAQHRILKMR